MDCKQNKIEILNTLYTFAMHPENLFHTDVNEPLLTDVICNLIDLMEAMKPEQLANVSPSGLKSLVLIAYSAALPSWQALHDEVENSFCRHIIASDRMAGLRM